MTSYLRKYVTAVASAKDYVAQWSSDRVFADEELIVPFPTLAILDPEKNIWKVHIKAWIYLPFQSKSLTSYLPSLPSFFTGSKSEEKNKESIDSNDENKIKTEKETIFNEEDHAKFNKKSDLSENIKVDKDKKDAAATVSQENDEKKERDESTKDKSDGGSESDDDMYEDALQGELGDLSENPGRLGLFFVGASVKVATKSIINGVEHLLQPSDESGFIDEQFELPDKEIKSLCEIASSEGHDGKFDYEILVNTTEKTDKKQDDEGHHKSFKCTIYVLAPYGVSIISDIDDTVKISNVLSKRLLLKHTFYSYFKPVEGMSDLYGTWSAQKCQFHYVSASPWQLYPALRCFLEKHKFPLGTMNLRKFSWSLEFFRPADTYKIETITEIINAYPLRKYVFVGDSGELDPEIYSKLYITYPKSIVHIFIRDVCHSPTCLPTCQERYTKAFEGVPKERWTVFKDPKEIEKDVNKLLSV